MDTKTCVKVKYWLVTLKRNSRNGFSWDKFETRVRAENKLDAVARGTAHMVAIHPAALIKKEDWTQWSVESVTRDN